MEEFIIHHPDIFFEVILAMFSAVGIYTAIRIDQKVLHVNYINLAKDQDKLEEKVDRHIENTEIHYHRRETDTTGRWPNYGG